MRASRFIALLAVGMLVPAAPGAAQAAEGDIVIMTVDSSRLPESAAAKGKSTPRPVGDGVEDALRDAGQGGVVLGRRLRIAREDDQCDAERAAAIAARAVAQGVHLVIGHVCASGAIRAAEIYAAAGLVMIATGPRHPRLTSPAGRRGIHRLAGRDDRQADSIAGFIAKQFPSARVAIIHDRSLQGRGMVEELRRSLAAAKIAPALIAEYASGIKDHAALVGELAAAKADLAVFPGQVFEASLILDQADRAGARIAAAIGTDVLAADAPPDRLLRAVDSFLVMLPWPGLRDAGANATLDDITYRLAGAAVDLWTAAVAAAGDIQAAAVTAALRGQQRATRIGPIGFDSRGDADVPSFVPHAWDGVRWQSRSAPEHMQRR